MTMTSGGNPLLPLFGVWIGYLALGLLFYRGDNADLKRQLWPVYSAGFGACFLWLCWRIGVLHDFGLILVPAAALISWLNARGVRFCGKCGMMYRRRGFMPFPAQCGKCGGPLEAE
jgi:hypothetical protein